MLHGLEGLHVVHNAVVKISVDILLEAVKRQRQIILENRFVMTESCAPAIRVCHIPRSEIPAVFEQVGPIGFDCSAVGVIIGKPNGQWLDNCEHFIQ